MKGWRHPATRALNAVWYGNHPARWLLWPVSQLFRALVALRRAAYRRGLLQSFDVGVPVVVVGNLSVGGTGKTPLVIWLATRLRQRGFRVGIVCSAYGGQSQSGPQTVTEQSEVGVVGDEAILLALRAGCPVVAGRDRVAAARLLLASGPLDLILADDGLQHYRLRRAIEIVVVDGLRGLGNGLCLPAGPLREPASRLHEADAVVVNAGDFGHRGMLRARLRITGLRELATGAERPLADFAGQAVHAVAAIGHPERFFEALEQERIEVDGHPHPDHAALTAADFELGDARPILITEKDAVKCARLRRPGIWCVVTELEFDPGHGERLLGNLDRWLDGRPANR